MGTTINQRAATAVASPSFVVALANKLATVCLSGFAARVGPPSETGSDIDMIRLSVECISVADAATGRLALSRKVDQAKGALFPDRLAEIRPASCSRRAGSQPDVMAITKWLIWECRKCWWG